MEFSLPEYEAPGEIYSGNNPKNFKLKDIFRNDGDFIDYLYDFGDHWEHRITLKGKCIPRSYRSYPLCIAGARRCPPEDVGGIGGYEELLKAIESKNKETLVEYKEWLGYEFNPDDFTADCFSIYFGRLVKRYTKGFSYRN